MEKLDKEERKEKDKRKREEKKKEMVGSRVRTTWALAQPLCRTKKKERGLFDDMFDSVVCGIAWLYSTLRISILSPPPGRVLLHNWFRHSSLLPPSFLDAYQIHTYKQIEFEEKSQKSSCPTLFSRCLVPLPSVKKRKKKLWTHPSPSPPFSRSHWQSHAPPRPSLPHSSSLSPRKVCVRDKQRKKRGSNPPSFPPPSLRSLMVFSHIFKTLPSNLHKSQR